LTKNEPKFNLKCNLTLEEENERGSATNGTFSQKRKYLFLNNFFRRS